MALAFEFNAEEIAALCRRHHVKRLAAFGSILRPDFDPQHSDADFVVEFEPLSPGQRMRSYLGLRADLEELLQRRADLVEEGAVRNPYILQKIADRQLVLYAA